LIGAGLMLRTFLNLVHLDPGFREDHLLTASLSLPHAQYKTGDQTAQFYDQLASSLNQLPGVESAGAGSDLPWTGYDENAGGFIIEGKKPPPNQEFHARYHMATPGYFSAIYLHDAPRTPIRCHLCGPSEESAALFGKQSQGGSSVPVCWLI